MEGRKLRVQVSPYVVDGERLFTRGRPRADQRTDRALKGPLGLSDEDEEVKWALKAVRAYEEAARGQ